ncbi:hypothetical protein IWX49DRAFT_591596 [Phyllosticta citricarpa]|uniref:Uncharacterized protein n=2 Tax=Phyllosticta TaxID=121621 RepID=A0ABR1M7C3_9PEZI
MGLSLTWTLCCEVLGTECCLGAQVVKKATKQLKELKQADEKLKREYEDIWKGQRSERTRKALREKLKREYEEKLEMEGANDESHKEHPEELPEDPDYQHDEWDLEPPEDSVLHHDGWDEDEAHAHDELHDPRNDPRYQLEQKVQALKSRTQQLDLAMGESDSGEEEGNLVDFLMAENATLRERHDAMQAMLRGEKHGRDFVLDTLQEENDRLRERLDDMYKKPMDDDKDDQILILKFELNKSKQRVESRDYLVDKLRRQNEHFKAGLKLAISKINELTVKTEEAGDRSSKEMGEGHSVDRVQELRESGAKEADLFERAWKRFGASLIVTSMTDQMLEMDRD